MAKYEIEFEGIGSSARDLVVFFTVGRDAAKRYCHVKVPYSALTDPVIVERCNTAVADRLRAAWEEDEPFIRDWQ
uniref:Uncharacterized protein n=1 Tax=uncultured prokaryote TaxID=198431 RepID=A0A0H5QNM7_9ZZZZ|nr:hypothetical protein [uncultured prokaryote]